jgi:F0F1-type ATP synthase assembly protein I
MNVKMQSTKQIQVINREGHISKDSQVEKKKTSENDFDYLRYANIGIYLIIPLLLGIFGGVQLDKLLHTKPLCVIIGIVFGAVASLYNLIRLTQENVTHKH